MIRSALGKVAWVGRTASMVFGLALVLALVVGVGSTALAHTGVDTKLFHLGHNNPVAALSKLTGNLTSAVFQVTNTSTANTTQNATAIGATNNSVSSPAMRATNAGYGTALELNVACNPFASACFKPAPMKVNSETKVANLNADQLDGQDSTAFLGANQKAADSELLDGKNASEFAADANQNGKADAAEQADNAGNADKVDQLDSTALLPGGDLPRGRTVRGNYDIRASTQPSSQETGTNAISFGYRLASTPTMRIIKGGATPPAECPGTVSSPDANPGYLCVYEAHADNLSSSSHPASYYNTRSGASLFAVSAYNSGTSPIPFSTFGTWAVTGN